MRHFGKFSFLVVAVALGVLACSKKKSTPGEVTISFSGCAHVTDSVAKYQYVAGLFPVSEDLTGVDSSAGVAKAVKATLPGKGQDSGVYKFEGVAPGTYQVAAFVDTSKSSQSGNYWYTATTVVVAPGAKVTKVLNYPCTLIQGLSRHK